MSSDGARREKILETAAEMFASSGLRTSLKDIADACGILPGSLYHHFDSKESIIVELVERYLADLDRVAKEAVDALHAPHVRPIEEHNRRVRGSNCALCHPPPCGAAAHPLRAPDGSRRRAGAARPG